MYGHAATAPTVRVYRPNMQVPTCFNGIEYAREKGGTTDLCGFAHVPPDIADQMTGQGWSRPDPAFAP